MTAPGTAFAFVLNAAIDRYRINMPLQTLPQGNLLNVERDLIRHGFDVVARHALVPHLKRLQSGFFVDVDYDVAAIDDDGLAVRDDAMPTAVLMSRDGRSVSVPLTWSARFITFGETAYNAWTVVPLAAPAGGEMLTLTVGSIANCFFGAVQ